MKFVTLELQTYWTRTSCICYASSKCKHRNLREANIEGAGEFPKIITRQWNKQANTTFKVHSSPILSGYISQKVPKFFGLEGIFCT